MSWVTSYNYLKTSGSENMTENYLYTCLLTNLNRAIILVIQRLLIHYSMSSKHISDAVSDAVSCIKIAVIFNGFELRILMFQVVDEFRPDF